MPETPYLPLTGPELVALVQRVFRPKSGEAALAILVDLPDAKVPDDPAWAARRELALAWAAELNAHRTELELDTHLVVYPNVHTNNGDLPERAWIYSGGPMPATDALDPTTSIRFTDLFATHPILIALTKFSATAPLKVAAKQHSIRAATMPGFRSDMVPALRLDYTEVNRRVDILKGLLDRAEGADLHFGLPDGSCRLHIDLRHRTGHASGGLFPVPGVAGNLPSGEAYIVPYEGEVPGDPSRTEGQLPVQFGTEIVRYAVCANQATKVTSEGPTSQAEADRLGKEPAYGNIAELGLGVLAAFGIKPIGEILLDEKLGLHIAFGRSDHFGGQVGPSRFSSPESVVHIDRVYVPETQPDVKILAVDLTLADGSAVALMRNGEYVGAF